MHILSPHHLRQLTILRHPIPQLRPDPRIQGQHYRKPGRFPRRDIVLPASPDGESEEDEGDEDAEDRDDEPGPGDFEVDYHGGGCAVLESRDCAGGTEAM